MFSDTQYDGKFNNLELGIPATFLYNGELYVIVKTGQFAFELFNVACNGENTNYQFQYEISENGATLTTVSCGEMTNVETVIADLEDNQHDGSVINYAGQASSWNVLDFYIEI